ncbi:hypothetical protein SAMN05216604_11642 [Pseudomonas agarici]|nr:hypothetical protein SAMN05216604_11642 [Pseudomonas agarici]
MVYKTRHIYNRRTECPALLILDGTRAIEGLNGAMRSRVLTTSKYPLQMELVCHKAFDRRNRIRTHC